MWCEISLVFGLGVILFGTVHIALRDVKEYEEEEEQVPVPTKRVYMTRYRERQLKEQ